MAQTGFAVETLARDGFGRVASSKVAGRELLSPFSAQVVSPHAPTDGKPSAVVTAEGAAPEVQDAAVFQWAGSPLFAPLPRIPHSVHLPRLVPRSYGIGPLSEASDLAVQDGPVAGALPSKGGTTHLKVLAATADLVALQNLTELRGKPREFVRALAGAREAIGPRPLLYAASVADPASVSLLVYMGVDVVDDFQALVAATAGTFLYTFGAVPGGLPGACHCPACLEFFRGASGGPHRKASRDSSGPKDGREGQGEDGDLGRVLGEGRGAASRRELPAVAPDAPVFKAALAHNRGAIHNEAMIAANEINAGTLREFVESRMRAYPWLVAALRNLDREFFEPMEALTPIWKQRLHALSHESLNRPEVRRWVERLRTRYRPPPSASVLLLVPCSARKPYSLSRTQRSIDRCLMGIRPAFAVHRAVVTSPLGIVPQELERVFPAAHYDIPVTGDWIAEEVRRVEDQVKALTASHHYRAVVSLVGDDLPELATSIPRTVECAAKGRPWDEALGLAARAVSEGLAGEKDVDPRRRTLEDLSSIGRFQFGPAAAEALFEGATARGRYPWSRVFVGKEQIAMHVPDRGRLALTLGGATRVAAAGAYRVEIGPFELKGDLFAVGVKAADPEIRIGDSVAVVREGEVVAAGFARMAGHEMLAMHRGSAVDIRHKA
jgi:archaeosine synthase alpha-subunit